MERSSSPPNRVIKRRNKKGSACTYCRQLKFKCDAAERLNSGFTSCTRCSNAKDGRRCVVDPSFKRTANKQRLDSLEKELEQMRAELRQRQTSPITTSPSVADLPGEHGSTTRGSESHRTPGEMDFESTNRGNETTEGNLLPPHSILKSSELVPEVVQAGGVELPPHDLLSLIEEFYSHFHPHFPILPDQGSFLANHQKNKLLLWTILAIASRESSQYSHLYQGFVDPVRRLAGEVYAPQSRSYETVQALLLLCVWPFPFQQTINDPSPMYIALATQIAYQLGLHRPAFRGDYTQQTMPASDPGELARKKVWFGCVVASHFVTTKLGIPSSIRPGHSVISELTQGNLSVIPDPLLSQLHLTHISRKASNTLGDYEYSNSGCLPECLSTVASIEREMLFLHEKFKHRWGLEVKLLYHSELLRLYSFVLDVSANVTVQYSDLDIDAVYTKCYDACLKLCQLAAAAPRNINYWPIFLRYAVMYGLFYAIPFANLEDIGSRQRSHLVEAVRGALVTFKAFGSFGKDHFARVAAHIDWLLSKLDQADRGDTASNVTICGFPTAVDRLSRKKRLTFSVKSRMSTNIMYEAIWTAKYANKSEDPQKPPMAMATPAAEMAPPPTMNGVNGMTGNDMATDASQLELPAMDLGMDNFVFTDGWENSGFLDIFADWQSLIGTQ